MNLKEQLKEWKKKEIKENTEISVSLFKKIVREAEWIENRTFGFRISKKTILENLSYAKVIAFNGVRSQSYGRYCCYRLSRFIGFSSTEDESIILRISIK